MPTSMFQFDSKRVVLKQLPDQRLKFYTYIENRIRAIFAALINKTSPVSEIKSQILQLRHALTMDYVDTVGRPI